MTYDNIEFVSKEEAYFYWYLKELIAAGYVYKWKYQPKPFLITKAIHGIRIIRGAKKTKTKSVQILKPHKYQADFVIYWNKNAENIFYVTFEDVISGKIDRYDRYPFLANRTRLKILKDSNVDAFSVIDVKGSYSQNDAHRRFSIEQKLVMEKANIYVQKIIPAPTMSKQGKVSTPSALFYRTFTPQRYLFTDVSGHTRKIRFPVRTMMEFISKAKIDVQLNLKV